MHAVIALAALAVPVRAAWSSPLTPQAQPSKVADGLLRGPTVPPNSSNVLAGTFAWERDGFVEPVACAATGDGRFIVVDACGVVRAMSAADGTTIWSADRGAGAAFVRPSSVACYGDGAVLVSDPDRGIVAMLSTADGSDLGSWPAEGALNGEWQRAAIVPGPIASAPGPADVPRVVVADARAPGRAMVCDGDVVRVCALPFVPAGVAIAADGSVLLTDRDGHGVTRMGPQMPADRSCAPPSVTWGGRGPYPGLLNSPRGVCAAGDWVLVADEHNHRIVRSDLSGAGKLAYGQHAVRPRAGGGKVHYPVAVAHDAESGLALICEPFERRVQAYRVNLDPEPAEVRVVLPSLEGVQSHFGAGADADGLRMVMQDPESASVVVFDLSLDAPAHVSTLGMAGTRPHEFVRIGSIAMSGEGALICVADEGARRVALWSLGPREPSLRFNPFAGRLVCTRSYESLGLLSHEGVSDAVASDAGFLLLVGGGAEGTAAPRMIAVNHLLESHESQSLSPPGDGRWMPRAIAWDGLARRPVWIAGRAGAPSGAPMRWAIMGAEASELEAQDPVDLCISERGHALVVDRLGDCIVDVPLGGSSVDADAQSSADAQRRKVWGGRGAADGKFWLPLGIVRHGEIVYVVDGGNHRGQAFTTDGAWLSTFSLGRSYTRPRSEAEVLGLPGAGTVVAAAPSPAVPAPKLAAQRRDIADSVSAKLWWSAAEGVSAATVPVRSNGGSFWVRARLESESPLVDASTPPLRRPFSIAIEAFEDRECTRPFLADAALIDSWMPHHRHGMNVAPRLIPDGPGRWRAEGMLMHMSGLWEVDVDLVREGRTERAQWNVELP